MDGEEASSLHRTIANQRAEIATLWNTVSILQESLRRADRIIPRDDSRYNIFTPQTVLALASRQGEVSHPAMASMRIHATYYDKQDCVVGFALLRSDLNRPILIGQTDEASTRAEYS